MEVSVKETMSGDPVSIDPEASALEALDLLVDRGIRHLPVVDGEGRVLRVLSIDDLRAAFPFAVSPRAAPSASERELARDWRVGEIMTYAPQTAREDDSLGEAAERMTDHRIGCLPVVDEAGKLAGLLSETDVMRALAASLWSDRVRERRGKEDELAALVRELRHEREQIARRLDQYHAVERELSTDPHDQPTDAAEWAADLRDVRITEGLDALAARHLDAIDQALDRAGRGHLGICERCVGRIPVTRLRSLPGTTLCVSCARLAEERAEA